MVDEHEWQLRRAREHKGLGELIAFADEVFESSGVGIAWSRHYGLGLLVHGVEIARAIRLCVGMDLPGPAFALARALYEAMLRGHVIVHEIGLKELNDLPVHTQRWQARIPTDEPAPKIDLRADRWRSVVSGTRKHPDFGKWRRLKSPVAIEWQKSIADMRMLHDLTHGGMTQALQMVCEDRALGTNYSLSNQTLLLCFAGRTVLFSIITWPGAFSKFAHEIERQSQESMERVEAWQEDVRRVR